MQIPKKVRRPSLKFAQPLLSQQQLHRILDVSAEDPRLRHLHDVVAIISNTGIRMGELSDLRLADVHVHQGLLVVNAKTGLKRRVPCGPKTLKILEARREREPESNYVFGVSRRALLRRVSRQLRTVNIGKGYSRFSLHVLRRTFLELTLQQLYFTSS